MDIGNTVVKKSCFMYGHTMNLSKCHVDLIAVHQFNDRIND